MDAASTRNDPRRLWARAATLSELLAGELVTPRADAGEERDARLDWFRDQLDIPGADSPRWQRYLDRAGWTEAEMERAARVVPGSGDGSRRGGLVRRRDVP